MTNFILVRHGYTDWIEIERLHGITDRPLSPFGLQQAEATAKYLRDAKITRLYTSPLKRALQTAEKITETTGVAATAVSDLREENYGWMEGRHDWWPAVNGRKVPTRLYTVFRLGISALTGEPFWQFRPRVEAAWRRLKAENSTGTVAVVAHAGVLRTILTHEFGGTCFNTEKYPFTACSVSRISVNGTSPRIISLNENAHLPGDNRL